mmetsp:Transcript_20148/g.57797  ORF Transcript_20148/g.57797 Transcript_20148/m.57797 type:complete len:569 (-) Transcript_20148:310-2016(-)|eukprot:CAMPEP_0181044156 /NCGR_PEP_ID=MMETSP1070-20121207/13107_1 /TAXON_ID=265543 /ORGANISM="Minutocellus polymorphus, Strain NH13" /LENGTH=568 /DNA_ID=CAMNT_0023122565 /DNA_START=22 /DNA_END=1728 /DNA_ORIENTATION=-
MAEASSLCCDSCGTAASDADGGAGLKICTRCRDVAYCSLSCQKEAWATHKKDCRPNYCRMAREALANGIEDKALSPDDIKTLGLALDRMEGGFHIHDISRFQIETGGPLQGCSLPEVQDAHKAMFYMSLLGNFFGVGQGVLVVGKTEDEPSRIGRVVDVEAPVECFILLYSKRKMHKYKVRILDVDSDDESDREGDGDVISLEPHRLRMLPINNKRHATGVGGVDTPFTMHTVPEGVDPDEFVFRDPFGDDIVWEYLDEQGEWVVYPAGVSRSIEGLYRSYSPHFLYSPGNPHSQGRFSPDAMAGETVGMPTARIGSHGVATRQIIFSDDLENMTERDLFSGLQRRVRRVGGEPRTGNAAEGLMREMIEMRGGVPQPGDKLYDLYCEVQEMSPRHAEEFKRFCVDWKDTSRKCGLCGSTSGPFIQMKCCGGTVCDTEDQYSIGSYERDGQCARNHRLNSICHFHHEEGHSGDWKSCQTCENYFHPYDYAVKATSQHVSGTVRRYNFDDNVRHDIHPADVPFPTCFYCDRKVDTTEESTKTLSMRKHMGGGKVRCSNHGGGFGKICCDR